MTGGRIKRILPLRRRRRAFCLTYGDGVGDVDITAVIDFHQRRPPRDRDRNPAAGRFGALAEGDRVTGFQEKPRGDGGWINGGFFVLSPKVGELHRRRSTVWEREPMERLAADGQLSRLFPQRLLAADGYVAGQAGTSKNSGPPARRLENLVRIELQDHAHTDHRQYGLRRPGARAASAPRYPDAELIGFDSGYFAHCLTGANRLPETLLDQQYFGDVREFPRRIARRRRRRRASRRRLQRPDGQQVRAGHRRDQLQGQRRARRAGRSSAACAISSSLRAAASMAARAGGAHARSDALNPLTAYARSKIATETGARAGSDPMA